VNEDEDHACRACGASLGTGSRRPAHLAVLEGPGEPARPRPRLESRAGPQVSARVPPQDDAVPPGASSWMARLEAAKQRPRDDGAASVPPGPSSSSGVTPSSLPQGAGPPPLPPSSSSGAAPAGPPPLKKPRRDSEASPSDEKLERKPAHLLVAELEAAERQRREARARKPSQTTGALEGAATEISSEIATHTIETPNLTVRRRQIPSWVFPVVAVLVVGGIGGAYYFAERATPEVKREVDPALIAREEGLRKANELVEQGHALFGIGRDPAKVAEAIPLYRRALEADPEFPRAHRALAVAYGVKGDDAEAVKHYRRFLELEPNSSEADQVRAIIEKYEKKGGNSPK
jgi:tetratricopeptide (TPR) repeat protein